MMLHVLRPSVRPPIIRDHRLRHLRTIADRRVPAGATIGTTPPARVTSAVGVVRAGAGAGITREGFLDDGLLHLSIGQAGGIGMRDREEAQESYFSRLRRAEIGHHHHVAGTYWLRHAQEASWREDNRRVDNGAQVRRIAGLAMKRKPSVDFTGYWQRHVKTA